MYECDGLYAFNEDNSVVRAFFVFNFNFWDCRERD